MSKALKIAGAIVGVVAIVASGGLGAPIAAAITGALGVGASTLTLIAAGLTLGSSLLAPRPKAPSTSPAADQRLFASIDARAKRKIALGGPTALNSDIRDQEYSSDQTYLDRFIIVASHKVKSAADEVWFDDKLAWTRAGGAQGEFAGYLWITPIEEGSAANAINISARMGDTRRYTGCAYLHVRYKLTGNSKKTESPFAQSIPTRITIIGKGGYLYDPRLDSTAGGDGPQRADDQTTWGWVDDTANNLALQTLWYMLGWRIQNPVTGAWKLAVGKGIPPARIDLESFITGANLCDEAVARAAGGTEPRYHGCAVFSEGDDPSMVLDNFKASMNGELDDADGKIRLTILHNDLGTPAAPLTTDDVLGEFKWSQTPPLPSTFNVIMGGYTDPSTSSLYQLIDYPEVRIDSPDGIDRIDTVNLPLVQSASQAQRLVKQRLQRQLYGGTFQATFQATAWRYLKGDVVPFSFAPLGWTGKLFRIVDIEVRVDGTVPMTLREEHADIYAWDGSDAAPVVGAEPTRYDYTLDPIYLDIQTPRAADGTPLEEVIGDVAGDVGAIDGRVGDVETALATAQADIASAQGELAGIGTSINVLQAVDLATATAQQQLDRDQHVLAEAMLRAVSEANTLRSNFRDAGIIVDPNTGTVRIYALDQVADRVSQAEVRLNGVDATIALTASQLEAYTDAAIATAVLDPSQIADLDTIFVRLTAAEIAIDGVEASVTTKADAVTVTALSGTVTSLSTSLTALTGVVAMKAESTTVTALDARVGSVESTVSTLGDVVGVGIDVRQSRYTGQQNGETSLRALLAGDAIGQRALSQLAAIQYELTTKIVDDVSAEAAQRLLLATRMASAEAALTSEQSARVTADAALTVNIGTLTASLATTNASLTSEQIARANADSALSGQITTLGATLSGVSATLSAEQITRADADTALSASIASLSASLGTTNASVSAEAIARADGDSALASSVTTLGSTVGGHTTTLSSYGAVLDGLQGKAGFQFDIDGRITGWQLNSGASSGELIFRVDRMRMVHPDTGEDLFVVEGGQAKLRNVEVDTLKVNTAIVPVRFQSSIAVPGGGATGALYEIARCEIVLPVDGYVEAIFNAQQGFASGNQDWNLVLTIDGDSRIVNAGRTNDTPTLVHGKLCSAGTVIVTAGWRAHNSVTLGDRILLAKGFPATA